MIASALGLGGEGEREGERGGGVGLSDRKEGGRRRREGCEGRKGTEDSPSSHVIHGSSREGGVVVSHPKEVGNEDGSTARSRARR